MPRHTTVKLWKTKTQSKNLESNHVNDTLPIREQQFIYLWMSHEKLWRPKRSKATFLKCWNSCLFHHSNLSQNSNSWVFAWLPYLKSWLFPSISTYCFIFFSPYHLLKPFVYLFSIFVPHTGQQGPCLIPCWISSTSDSAWGTVNANKYVKWMNGTTFDKGLKG